MPTRWLNEDAFYPDEDAYMPVPDPDAEGMRVLEWPMQPGDAVAFDFRILHGARGNESAFGDGPSRSGLSEMMQDLFNDRPHLAAISRA